MLLPRRVHMTFLLWSSAPPLPLLLKFEAKPKHLVAVPDLRLCTGGISFVASIAAYRTALRDCLCHPLLTRVENNRGLTGAKESRNSTTCCLAVILPPSSSPPSSCYRQEKPCRLLPLAASLPQRITKGRCKESPLPIEGFLTVAALPGRDCTAALLLRCERTDCHALKHCCTPCQLIIAALTTERRTTVLLVSYPWGVFDELQRPPSH